MFSAPFRKKVGYNAICSYLEITHTNFGNDFDDDFEIRFLAFWPLGDCNWVRPFLFWSWSHLTSKNIDIQSSKVPWQTFLKFSNKITNISSSPASRQNVFVELRPRPSSPAPPLWIRNGTGWHDQATKIFCDWPTWSLRIQRGGAGDELDPELDVGLWRPSHKRIHFGATRWVGKNCVGTYQFFECPYTLQQNSPSYQNFIKISRGRT